MYDNIYGAKCITGEGWSHRVVSCLEAGNGVSPARTGCHGAGIVPAQSDVTPLVAPSLTVPEML